jgi:hypothetical protein
MAAKVRHVLGPEWNRNYWIRNAFLSSPPSGYLLRSTATLFGNLATSLGRSSGFAPPPHDGFAFSQQYPYEETHALTVINDGK